MTTHSQDQGSNPWDVKHGGDVGATFELGKNGGITFISFHSSWVSGFCTKTLGTRWVTPCEEALKNLLCQKLCTFCLKPLVLVKMEICSGLPDNNVAKLNSQSRGLSSRLFSSFSLTVGSVFWTNDTTLFCANSVLSFTSSFFGASLVTNSLSICWILTITDKKLN